MLHQKKKPVSLTIAKTMSGLWEVGTAGSG